MLPPKDEQLMTDRSPLDSATGPLPVYYDSKHGPIDLGYYQHVAAAQQTPRRSRAKRFFRAVGMAIGMWALVSFIAHGAIWSPFYSLMEVVYDTPSNVDLHDCLDVESLPHHSGQAKFAASIPLKNTLLLLGSGGLISGNVHVSSSSDFQDEARFDVTVDYNRRDFMELVKLCTITREDGEAGLGIFTPQRWSLPRRPWGRRPVVFDIQLTLPSNTVINSFEANIPNIPFKIDDLDKVTFRSLSIKASNAGIQAATLLVEDGSLQSSNAHINVESLLAQKALVRSSNGKISGKYSSNSSLELITSNGAIDASVTLQDDETSDKLKALSLHLSTSNGAIDTTINLLSTRKNPPRFNLDTKTSNNRLNVKIPSIPTGAILTFDGSTSNGKVDVGVSPTYEGSFRVSTSNGPAILHIDEQDPTNRGRSRAIEQKSLGRTAFEGRVYWKPADGDDKEGSRSRDSSIVVRTSNNIATLSI